MKLKISPLLFLTIFLGACFNNDLDVNTEPLQGTINGTEWQYESGNGYIFSSDLKYEFKLLSDAETGAGNPCGVPNPTEPHLSFIIEPRINSFSVPLPILQESVRFHEGATGSAFATSGFLEIYSFNNSVITGYLQAILDDENTVEGTFEAILCN